QARSVDLTLLVGDTLATAVERFFGEFSTAARVEYFGEWGRVGERWHALRDRYSARELRRFERVAGQIATALDARIEGVVRRSAEARRALPTHYDVACLAQHLLLLGRAAVEE